jgi:DNA-binding transcriptional MerR regulator
MSKSATERFDVRKASRLSGLTPRMLDYLYRAGILPPSIRRSPGRGRKRYYSFGDVVVLRLLAQLLRCGISVSKLRKSLRVLRSRHRAIKPDSVPEQFLVTDGSRIYFRQGKGVLEDLSPTGQLAFAFVVELRKVRDEVVALDADGRESRRIGGLAS